MDKMVQEVRATAIDGIFLELGLQGGIRILFTTEGANEFALIPPPAVLASLEAKLASVTEEQRGGQRSQ